MRVVFSEVEHTAERLLTAWAIDRFDPRLLRWRRRALELFEQAWGLAGQEGRAVGPGEAAWLYGRCLQRAVAAEVSAAAEDPAGLLGPDWAAELVGRVAG